MEWKGWSLLHVHSYITFTFYFTNNSSIESSLCTCSCGSVFFPFLFFASFLGRVSGAWSLRVRDLGNWVGLVALI
jgi:hypothetical protein